MQKRGTKSAALYLIFSVIIILLTVNFAQGACKFSDDMENTSSGNWTFDAPWGYTNAIAHGGSYCITDSPGTSYANGVNGLYTGMVRMKTGR